MITVYTRNIFNCDLALIKHSAQRQNLIIFHF